VTVQDATLIEKMEIYMCYTAPERQTSDVTIRVMRFRSDFDFPVKKIVISIRFFYYPQLQPCSDGSAICIWAVFDGYVLSTKRCIQDYGEAVRMQLMEYLRAPPIPRDSSPFQWLRQTSSQQEPPFPLVTRLARMMLSIPATSVSSERLFSKAGDVITKKRNRLSLKNAENIVFLLDNAV
jgi:hypothetical protein